MSAIMSAANSIKVVARFRPQNKIELESGGKPIVTFESEDSCRLDVSERRRRAQDAVASRLDRLIPCMLISLPVKRCSG